MSKRNRTVQQTATIFDMHVRVIRRMVKDGCPHSRRGTNKQLFFDETEVAKWLEERGRTGKPGRPKTKEAVATESIERELKVEKLLKLRQERLLRDGKLHDVAECLDLQIRKIHYVKGELLSIPRIVAVQLVGLEAHEIEVIIEEAIIRVCRIFAGEIDTSHVPRCPKCGGTGRVMTTEEE